VIETIERSIGATSSGWRMIGPTISGFGSGRKKAELAELVWPRRAFKPNEVSGKVSKGVE
jgi:hypothetical protein